MSKQRVGTPVSIGELVIEPVEEIAVRVEQVGFGIVGFVFKRPVSVIVRSPAGTFRLDLEAHEFADDGGWAEGG